MTASRRYKICILGQGQRMQEVPVVALGVTQRRGAMIPDWGYDKFNMAASDILDFFYFSFLIPVIDVSWCLA